MDLEVKHDEKAGKYYAVVDGLESVCEYGPAGDRVLNFSHTYVPSALRGRGIADGLSATPWTTPLPAATRSSPPAGSSASTWTGMRSTRRSWPGPPDKRSPIRRRRRSGPDEV